MNITFIEVENLRSLKRARIDLTGAAAFLVGMNGEGKSTLLNAVRMALWGRCEYTDRGGKGGADDLVGDDGNEARVLVGLGHPDGNIVLAWSMDRAGGTTLDVMDVAGKPKFHGQQKDLRRRVAEYMGLNWLHAEVAADPGGYLASGELTSLLAELVTGDLTEERLRGVAGEHADGLLRFAGVAGVALKGVADLEKLGKVAVEERKGVKNKIKNCEQELAAIPDVDAPMASDGKTPLTEEHVPQIEKALAQFETQLEDLLIEKGAAGTQLSGDALDAKKRELYEIVAEYRRSIEADEAELKTAQASKVKLDKEIPAILDAEADAEAEKAQADTALEVAKAEVARVAKLKGACPTCGQSVSKEAYDKMSGGPSKAMAEAQFRVKTAGEAVAKAVQAADRARQEKVELSTAIPGLTNRIADAKSAASENERKLADLELQEPPRDAAVIDDEIAALRIRMANGKAKLDALRSWTRREEVRKKLDGYTEERAFLEWACDALDKGELAAALMRECLGAFEDACNAELKPFGLELAVKVQGRSVDAMVGKSGERKRRYSGLSKSERTLTQLALASAYGRGGIALLDDLDGLDSNRKLLFFRSLRTARDRFGTMLVAAAWGAGKADPDGLAKALSPMQVVWVGGGTVKTPAAPAREDAA